MTDTITIKRETMQRAHNLYEVTGDVLDINTLLVSRAVLRQVLDALEAKQPGANTGTADEWDDFLGKRKVATHALRAALQQAEQITHVAIEYEGKVWKLPRPNRHHHVIRMIGGINGPDVQGFVTNTGRFLNRIDAFKLAQSNGQLDRSWHPKNSYNGNELYSEDLWKSAEQVAPQAQVEEPVTLAWCELTQDGKSIAHFDGRPMIMCGAFGNEHHKTQLITLASYRDAITKAQGALK